MVVGGRNVALAGPSGIRPGLSGGTSKRARDWRVMQPGRRAGRPAGPRPSSLDHHGGLSLPAVVATLHRDSGADAARAQPQSDPEYLSLVRCRRGLSTQSEMDGVRESADLAGLSQSALRTEGEIRSGWDQRRVGG